MRHQLLLICSMFWLSLGQAPLTYYMLMIPAEMQYPSTERACVHVIGCRENVTLTITLQAEDQDITLHQEVMTGPTLYRCVSFQVPAPADGLEEVMAIHISLLGGSLHLSESKNVLIRYLGCFTMIQTDKPIYNPGEFVNFLILRFDRDFRAVNDKVSLVQLKNPKGNLIGQWSNLRPRQGVIELSYTLDSECLQGIYTIKTPDDEQEFHVEEHVLPRFEVLMHFPAVVTLLDKTFRFKICGRQNFGKPVLANVSCKLCRKAVLYYWNALVRPSDLCTFHSGQTDKAGCAVIEVATASYELQSYNYQMKFEVEASLVENGTGIQINGTGSCPITALVAKVTLKDFQLSDSYYKPGLRYKGMMKLEGPDESPMRSQTLFLTVKYGRTQQEWTYESDEHGQVSFTLDTKPWKGQSVTMSASYKKEKPEEIYGQLSPFYLDAHMTLLPYNSITKSFLKIQRAEMALTCLKKHLIDVDYHIRGSELMGNVKSLKMQYMVTGKGNLVMNGQMTINVNRSSVFSGTLKLPLMVTADIAPVAYVFVYVILNNGRVSADSERFPVEKCFNNRVTMDFSQDLVSPGSNVSLRLTASPGSLCLLRVVDESVDFLKPKAEISVDSLYNELEQRNRYGYPYEVQEEEPACLPPHLRFNKRSLEIHQRQKRSFYYQSDPNSLDPYSLFKTLGTKILTNAIVKTPTECRPHPHSGGPSYFALDHFAQNKNPPLPFNDPFPVMEDRPRDVVTLHATDMKTEIKKIRKKLLSTWLWKLVPVGSSGEVVLDAQIPDGITKWKTTTLCMGDVGLGLAPPASIMTFQPIFIASDLPYSVVRGEVFTVKSTAFNYLQYVVMITVSILDSPDMEVVPCPGCSYTQCLTPEEPKVFNWKVRAQQIGVSQVTISADVIPTSELCDGKKPIVPENGTSDTLVKTLIVKPEGMVIETSQNSVLCTPGNLSSEVISIVLPPDVVPGSARAEISVTRDLLASSLQDIEDLLSLPYGCGEQNMMPFSINYYLMRYLEETNQLTPALRTRGENYLKKCYQRQLSFKRADRVFSAFGDKDMEGNTWLNALVLKIMSASSRYIPIEKEHINDIVNWLKENQLPSGCFANKGKLFKQSMKGGVDDEATLTAYTVVALLEVEKPTELQEMLECALRYLRSTVSQVDEPFTLAILAYAFTASGDMESRDETMRKLYEKAVHTDGQVYWPLKPSDSSSSKPISREVELASYVILAHTCMENPSKKDISDASKIMSWLSERKGPHGGFASTQDTMVALQAFCQYAKLTFAGHKGSEVTVTGDNTQHTFLINEETRLLQQRRHLQKIPGVYTAQAKGEGCHYVQTTLRYNMIPTETSTAFHLEINLHIETCQDKSEEFCVQLLISVQYTGERPATSMTLIEANLPSGFSAEMATIQQLEAHRLVKKTETRKDKVIIYINELSHQTESFSFSIKQDIKVENLHPQLLRAFDYYSPDEEALVMYNLPTQ